MSNGSLLAAVIASNPGLSHVAALRLYKTLLLEEMRIQQEVLMLSSSDIGNSTPPADTTSTTPPAGTQHALKIDAKNAIQDDKVSCCICGKDFKTLTKGHLAEHALTRDGYLALCGYPKGTSLMSLNQIAARREKVREVKPWERTERWQAKQARETTEAEKKAAAAAQATGSASTPQLATAAPDKALPKKSKQPKQTQKVTALALAKPAQDVNDTAG